MATKSILQNINITKKPAAKSLLKALENAKANPGQTVVYQRPYRELKKDDILFAVPSFTSGIARVLDLGATLNVYNNSPTGDIADERAILADWQQVGIDLTNAMPVRGGL